MVPNSPESEILAKCFADMGEKCGENLVKNFTDFRPSIPRAQEIHEKLSTHSASRETRLFHRETLGAWGRKKTVPAVPVTVPHFGSWENGSDGSGILFVKRGQSEPIFGKGMRRSTFQ